MIIKEYIEKSGQSPFEKWFETLESVAAAKVTTALYRLEQSGMSINSGKNSEHKIWH